MGIISKVFEHEQSHNQAPFDIIDPTSNLIIMCSEEVEGLGSYLYELAEANKEILPGEGVICSICEEKGGGEGMGAGFYPYLTQTITVGIIFIVTGAASGFLQKIGEDIYSGLTRSFHEFKSILVKNEKDTAQLCFYFPRYLTGDEFVIAWKMMGEVTANFSVGLNDQYKEILFDFSTSQKLWFRQ